MPLPRANAGGDASLLHEPARPSGDSRRRRGGRRVLGGLIGLGGAEFRLPLLVRVFEYDLERAVFLNLAVSLVTVVSALASRLAFGVGPSVLASGLDLVVALAADSAFGAYRGAVSGGVSEAGLHRAVRALGAGCTAGASVKAPKIPLAAYLGDTAQPAAPSTCLDASSEGRLGQFITVYRNKRCGKLDRRQRWKTLSGP